MKSDYEKMFRHHYNENGIKKNNDTKFDNYYKKCYDKCTNNCFSLMTVVYGCNISCKNICHKDWKEKKCKHNSKKSEDNEIF